MSVKNNIRAT